MPSSPSFTGRIFIAVGFMIGFYLLAFVMAGALLYIPYTAWMHTERLQPGLVFFCLLGAGAILWGIFPRRHRFVPPGPPLDPKDHPKLFEVLTEIATAMQQKMPSAVYLTAEANAWVSDRGGVMGFRTRRIMGLGLALLQALTVSELRAVLAHEFGHFCSGDTKLGPWLYKTRAAMAHTLEGLARYNALLQRPFLWYGKAFLRATQAISRRQEFVADALAARVVGADAVVNGLKQSYGTTEAFESYWLNEVEPILRHGFQPPLAEGFRRYLASPRIAGMISSGLARELAEGEADPYDTHPPLRARIAALEPQSDDTTQEPEPLGISLVGEIETLEARLIEAVSAEPSAQPLRAVAWDDVGEKIWGPNWQDFVGGYATALAGITTRTLPQVIRDLDRFTARLRESDGADLAEEARAKHASATLSLALAVALRRRGWELGVSPGEEGVCTRNGMVVKPFEVIARLASGEFTADTWQDFCRSVGIADLALGVETTLPQEDSAAAKTLYAAAC